MPTEFGSELFKGHQPMTDAACVRALRRAARCWSARPSRCVSAAAIRRARAIRSTPAARRAARRAAPRPRWRRGCCRSRSAPTRAARPSGRRASAAPMRSSRRSAPSTARARSRWPTAWTISACSPERCPTCGRQRASSSARPAAIRVIRASTARSHPPPPHKPARLIRLDTAGWPVAEPAAKAAFEAYLSRLADAGVEIITRRDDAAIEAYEIGAGRHAAALDQSLPLRNALADAAIPRTPPRTSCRRACSRASRTAPISPRKPIAPR